MSLPIHSKYKYFNFTLQRAEDRRRKFHFCRLPFAVNVMLNLSNVDSRPSIWFRHVDDTFALFDNVASATRFLQYLNTRHPNINFTIEFEEIPFLDVRVKRNLNTVKSCVSKFYGFVNLRVIFNNTCRIKSFFPSGAIIGDGDRKRALFLVLGLASLYGTIFLFLEQIAPSPTAHARTCCEDFCGCRAGEMASEIHEIFYDFGPQLNTFMSVGIWLKYCRRKLLQFE